MLLISGQGISILKSQTYKRVTGAFKFCVKFVFIA